MRNKSLPVAAIGLMGALVSYTSAYGAPDITSTNPYAYAPTGNSGASSAASFGQEIAKQQAMSQVKSFLPYFGGEQPEWLKRFEVNWNFLNESKPEQSILTVQPLYQSNNKQDTVFVQGSLYHYALYGDYRWTGNIGTGYRRLLADNQVLLGANTFFDNEFSYSHRRMSLGAEAKWGPLDFGFNNYIGLSGDQSVDGDIEKALGGRDLKLTTQLPFVPWAKIGGGYFIWDADRASRDMSGSTFSAELALHPNLSVAYKWSSFDVNNNAARGQNEVLLRFTLARLGSPSLSTGPIVSNKAFETRDLTNETLAKVERENRIIVERRASNGNVIIARGD
ncbi:MAG: inverse autotransporter beta domain-containing protein [Alphaproteobacteria bacterium]|nr:inverse autotransporter beta domain-containing protein [Alphaproteobacteria bacterium]